jgi:hypothetical protein
VRAATLLALVILAGGCGGGGEGESPEDVARQYLDALKDHDGDRACGLLTSESRHALDVWGVIRDDGTDCGDMLGGRGARGRIAKVDREGRRAKAHTTGDPSLIELRQDRGRWFVDRSNTPGELLG